MGMIPQVTCRHCRKKYSKLKKHCPYCGLERVRQSTRSAASTASTIKETTANQRVNNAAKYRLIFGVVILVAVIACTIAMVSISIQSLDAAKDNKQETGQATTALSDKKKDETNTGKDDDKKTDGNQQDNAGQGNTDNTASVTSIVITYLSTEKTEFSMGVGDTVQLGATVYPQSETERQVVWSSSNTSVITVSTDGLVTAISSGEANVVVTCEGIQQTCKVYVW